ncbi:ArsB/NhaD family transporter [Psychrobacter piscatorii]|uniref:ArsB/NhaD family transporter n=1 Tax=Psychrobacter piscatorii TaxID=554343 RepID=UPI0037362098
MATISPAIISFATAGRWWQSGRDNKFSMPPFLGKAHWQIVLFSIVMYLVVYGLGNAGITAYGAQILNWLGHQGNVIATVGTGFLSAIVASVVNNMPSTLIGALAIDSAQGPVATRNLMIYANVIGNNLGPKPTPIGSLATLLWLHILAEKDCKISWGQYMKIGLLITPSVLLVTLLALVFLLPSV